MSDFSKRSIPIDKRVGKTFIYNHENYTTVTTEITKDDFHICTKCAFFEGSDDICADVMTEVNFSCTYFSRENPQGVKFIKVD